MSTRTGLHILFNSGGPVVFLVFLCAGLGALFLSLGSSAGLVFILAGTGSLVVFFITARAILPATADYESRYLSTVDRRRHAR